MHEYLDVFEGIGKFPGPSYCIHVDPGITPKQTHADLYQFILKMHFKKKSARCCRPWINSFVLIESKDNQGQLKLRIYLDPTNLNKAVTREPYHFCTPEDISHMLADACILTVCNCKKGYWHQRLDEASSYLTLFNTEICRYRFAVMPFGITVAGDVFQCKLDKCFSHIKNLIIIVDGIMAVGRKHNHKDHDLALTTLLQMARNAMSNSIMRNYDTSAWK